MTDVVLTHLHMDHVGGLLVDGVRDRLRPDLRVHLASLVPVRLPCGGRRRRLSLGTGRLGLLTVCWVRPN